MEEEHPLMANTDNLELPILSASQAQKHVTMNESLLTLDRLVQSFVLDKDLSTPPGSPSDEDAYIVGSSATDAWLGQEDSIAVWDGVWNFFSPNKGWIFYVDDEDAHYYWNGSSWTTL